MTNITIRKNPQYNLKIPAFKCDKKLKDNCPPPYDRLVDGYKFLTILGRPKSGKTSLLISLFSDERLLKKTFGNVIICIPSSSLSSIDPKHNPFKKIPDERRFTSLDSMPQILDLISYYCAEGMDSCLVIDDETAGLKDTHIQRSFQQIINNRRHLKCSIILLSQTYKKIPLDIRKLIDLAIVMFKPSKPDMEAIFQELFEMSKEMALRIMDIAFKKNFDALMLEVVSQRLWALPDELIIEDK